ncbi:MAG: hypothetical protein G01um101438_133 [Parcubacteria group bacterium Gr01-1014_38]|nr:MAG: hypothetical protein G01um101438_133 [Parcubacteria group bacterium Gr01-1014_38]
MESALRKGEIPRLPPVVPEELSSIRTGIYIAVFERLGRKPRGRVGSYLPTKLSLAEEIIHQTVRLLETFPFQKEDLPHLMYELRLTKSPALLADLGELKPDAGLLVRTSAGKAGVSLPSAREQTPDKRFGEACAHGDINPKIEDTRLYMFAVETITEDAP